MMQIADLRQAINVRFARAEIAAFDRVVKKPVNAVAIVLIILRGIDSALRRDAVRAPRAVLVTKALHVVTQLSQRRRGRTARQTGADDDDLKFPPVVRRDELGMVPMVRAICPPAAPMGRAIPFVRS